MPGAPLEIRIPNDEIRIKSECPNDRMQCFPNFFIRTSDFGFPFPFGFRNSGFGFNPLAHLRHVRVRAGDDVDGDDFSDAPAGFGPGVDRGADSGDVTLEGDRDQAAADLVLLDERNVRGFKGGVEGLDGRHDALGFDQSDCFTVCHGNSEKVASCQLLVASGWLLVPAAVAFYQQLTTSNSSPTPPPSILPRSILHSSAQSRSASDWYLC